MKTIVTSIITTIATVAVLFLASTMIHSSCSKSSAMEGNEKCTMNKEYHGEKSCHKWKHNCMQSSDCPYAKENACKSHKDGCEKYCSKMGDGSGKHCDKMDKMKDGKHCNKSATDKKEFSCKHHKMNMNNGDEEIIEKKVTVEVSDEK